MRFLFTIFFLTFTIKSFPQSDNLTSIGIPDSILQIKDPGINKYRSIIDFPIISSPVFIAQGYNDPRVYYKQSQDIVRRLRQNNKTVWYLMAKDEGHGFKNTKKINAERNTEIAFLKKYLLE